MNEKPVIKNWNEYGSFFYEKTRIIYSKSYSYVMYKSITKYFLSDYGELALDELRPQHIRASFKKLESSSIKSSEHKSQICEWIIKVCSSAAAYGYLNHNPAYSVINPYALS